MNSLLIRADGNYQIGTGHMMRCLALAQAWQETGGEVHFAFGEGTTTLETRLREEKVALHDITAASGSAADAAQTVAIAERVGSARVAVDGYQFDAAYQQTIEQADLQLLFIDDYGHADYYFADIVLNQNVYAVEGLYENRSQLTRLLLGTRYALLRREFWPWRGWRREITRNARKILVTLGGGDPDNVALEVIRAIRTLDVKDVEVVVIVGNSNPHWQTLHQAAKVPRGRFRLERDVTDMPALMAWADVAISAGGSTCWELAFMGLPALVITLADNQKAVGPGMEARGAAINLGWHRDLPIPKLAASIAGLLADFDQRSDMSRNGQKLVDGFGAARVVQHIHAGGVHLRKVVEEDAQLIWEWANDPETRSASFSTRPIPWENHVAWFSQKLKDPGCLFYLVADSKSTPIGQIRFQVDGDEAVVSVSLSPIARRRGYGHTIIWLGVQQVFDHTSVNSIYAYIKPGNQASMGAFSKAGFTRIGAREIQGILADHYVLER